VRTVNGLIIAKSVALRTLSRPVVSEIWPYNIQLFHTILPDYKFHYALPYDTSVGGVGVHIKSKYSQTVVKDYAIKSSDTSRNENLWIQIINGKTKYIIGGIYRHPSGSLTEFSNNLEETMCKVSKCNVPCIIAGDININLLHCSTDRHIRMNI